MTGLHLNLCLEDSGFLYQADFFPFPLRSSSFVKRRIHYLALKNLVRIYPTTSILVGFVGNPNTFSLKWFSSSSIQQSFTVSYLINSLGFSQQSALKVSNRLNFDTCEKPEKVINLFKKYGFSQTQISRLLRGRPELLIADSERIISPKLEFFDAKGVSWPQFSKKLSQFPTVLGSSLAKQIRPSYAFLRNFIQSDEKAIKAVERYPNILVVDVEKCLVPNIDVLRGHGVPDCNIAKLVPSQPKAFTLSSDRFREVVEEVVEMGFNPERLNFVQAVLAFRCSSKSTRECKVNAFKRWGWSEEEVLKAFERHPWCMMLSEDKIFAGMDFFMNKMGLQPCLVAKYPVILSLSLKKRLIPRSSVFQALLSKGLVKKKFSLHQLFMVSDSKFLQKFVVPHEKEAPELLKLYKEKLDLSYGPEIGDKVCREVS
ncbi:hypothetical protein TIFTF001_015629 [Ficus carica]|uniref:Uncharacterized protein n=1 Tax=Ficus carica TaxID=3494 RepID=A0AA88A669_FICCA|nr:hypothetical protein TIFTF001_015629 [Ficus carica]